MEINRGISDQFPSEKKKYKEEALYVLNSFISFSYCIFFGDIFGTNTIIKAKLGYVWTALLILFGKWQSLHWCALPKF